MARQGRGAPEPATAPAAAHASAPASTGIAAATRGAVTSVGLQLAAGACYCQE